MIPATGIPSFPPVFGIWMSDGNQLPPAGETACPTYFAKRLIQQGGAGGFACRSHGHNQWSASKMNKFPKTVKHPTTAPRLMRASVRKMVDHEFVTFSLARTESRRAGHVCAFRGRVRPFHSPERTRRPSNIDGASRTWHGR